MKQHFDRHCADELIEQVTSDGFEPIPALSGNKAATEKFFQKGNTRCCITESFFLGAFTTIDFWEI